MSSESLNPYAASTADLAAEVSSPESWKAIAQRWERLRPLYNLIVGIAGILAILMVASSRFLIPSDFAGVLLYGVGANVCYLFGPVGEMYLNWFADIGERRFLPAVLVQLVRGRATTWLLFFGGTACSVLLTLAIGAIEGFAAAVHIN